MTMPDPNRLEAVRRSIACFGDGYAGVTSNPLSGKSLFAHRREFMPSYECSGLTTRWDLLLCKRIELKNRTRNAQKRPID